MPCHLAQISCVAQLLRDGFMSQVYCMSSHQHIHIPMNWHPEVFLNFVSTSLAVAFQAPFDRTDPAGLMLPACEAQGSSGYDSAKLASTA